MATNQEIVVNLLSNYENLLRKNLVLNLWARPIDFFQIKEEPCEIYKMVSTLE